MNEIFINNISAFAEERLTNMKKTTNEAKYIITKATLDAHTTMHSNIRNRLKLGN